MIKKVLGVASSAQWNAETRLRIRHLVLIDSLAETGNMRLTAAAMNLSQPAISKLLQDAENALGEKLFERSRRGATATSAGDVMIFELVRCWGIWLQLVMTFAWSLRADLDD